MDTGFVCCVGEVNVLGLRPALGNRLGQPLKVETRVQIPVGTTTKERSSEADGGLPERSIFEFIEALTGGGCIVSIGTMTPATFERRLRA
jgi:hypothetical protein